MKKQKISWILAAAFLLAAGLCGGCGYGNGSAAGEAVFVPEGGTNPEDGMISEGGTNPEDGMISVPEDRMDPESGKNGEAETAAEADEEVPEDPGGSGSASGDFAVSAPALLYVHICGEVKNPGVYELEEGSRIFQAVEKAGGFTEEAAESYLNMAQEVADGMKIVVPSEDEIAAQNAQNGIGTDAAAGLGAGGGTSAWISGAAGGGSGAAGGVGPGISGVTEGAGGSESGGKVNLNTADKATLMTLKGIGEARAEDIIAYREEHGPFRKIEDVMKVSGIKEAAFEKIKEEITV